MLRAYLTPFVIAGLLFLPSCSSAEAKACEAAEISRDTYDKKAGGLQDEAKALENRTSNLDLAFKKFNLEQEAIATYKLSLQVIVTYKECFTPEQVVEAQRFLDNNNK